MPGGAGAGTTNDPVPNQAHPRDRPDWLIENQIRFYPSHGLQFSDIRMMRSRWRQYPSDQPPGYGKIMLKKKGLLVPLVVAILLAVGGAARSTPQTERTASGKSQQHGNAAEFMPAGKVKDSGCVADGKLPDKDCTPGVVMGLTVEEICSTKTGPRRNVTEATKKQVFAEYGISYPAPKGVYEVDHFIPLELGGSNDISNLWPEPANPTPGFHQKDLEENYLHKQVCTAKAITLADAQRTIATDWLKYYNDQMPH
jgi:hypothetical protein